MTMKKPVRALERLLFVLLMIATVPLMLLWFAVPAIGGLFIGLPVAAIKFIFTGTSGIEWYMDVVMEFVLMKWPMMLWLDRLEGR